MSFISILIASASLTLGMAEPAAGGCPLCAAKDDAPKVEAAAYGKAEWPAHNPQRNLYSSNFQGKPMPMTLGKETVLSSDLSHKDTEGKVLVIDFWATWCGPCIAAAPKLEKLQKAHADNLMVVGVAGLNEDQNAVESYLKGHDESYLQLFDPDMKVFKEFDSTGIPLVLVVSTDGVIRWMGNPLQPEFESIVNAVVSADPLIQAKNKTASKANP
ncbi:MAG: TlpA family protein disulfide reductase [Phycisphaerales bacterium]